MLSESEADADASSSAGDKGRQLSYQGHTEAHADEEA